jgi:hypothetical protein
MPGREVYLFFGCASEYVLAPLRLHMERQGYKTVEIDLFENRACGEVLRALHGTPVVLVNTAHLFYDQVNFDEACGPIGEIVSPLEVIDYLSPVRSIYVCHDLVDYFHERELPWLDLFDHLLIPGRCPPYLRFHGGVVTAGWIKRAARAAPPADDAPRRVGVALTDLAQYGTEGPEVAYEVWRTVLEQGVACKLPHDPGADAFEELFRARNVVVYPSDRSISDFIDGLGIVVTTGLSSVNAEAALAGRLVINVTDIPPGAPSDDFRPLRPLPNLRFMTLAECSELVARVKLGAAPIRTVPPQVLPFDFDLATRIAGGGVS